MKKRNLILVAVLVLLAGMWLWSTFSPSTVPSGQPELARIEPGAAAPFVDAFNAARGQIRVVTLLSPT